MKKNVNVNVNGMNGAAIDNAKVLNTQYKLYKYGTQGFINSNGTVVFVTVTSVKVDLKNQVVTTIMKDAKGMEYTITGEFMMYESTSAYEDSKKVNRFIYRTVELLRKADPMRTSDCTCPVIDEVTDKETGETTSNTYMEVWTFVDGDAVCVPATVYAVTWDESGWHMTDGQLPENFWKSKYDVYRFNEYRIIDEDGDEFIEKGVDLRLKPTTEQFAALKALKDAFEKAKTAGLAFLWDRECCGNIKAYNTADVEDFDYCAVSEKGGTIIEPDNVALTDTGIDFFDYIGNDDYCFALKPTARQLKQWAKEHPDAK